MRTFGVPNEVCRSGVQGKDGTSPRSRVALNSQRPAATLPVTFDVALARACGLPRYAESCRSKCDSPCRHLCADDAKKADQSSGLSASSRVRRGIALRILCIKQLASLAGRRQDHPLWYGRTRLQSWSGPESERSGIVVGRPVSGIASEIITNGAASSV